jgi:hypothetical protein
MIFEFTTKGREGGGRDGFGLCVATSEDALGPVVVNTYRSGLSPLSRAMPLRACASPGQLSQTVGSCVRALPAFLNSGFGPSVLGCGFMAASRLPLWKRFLPRLGGELLAGAPRPFQSLALKLFHELRDLVVQSNKGFVEFHRNLLPLVHSTAGGFHEYG